MMDKDAFQRLLDQQKGQAAPAVAGGPGAPTPGPLDNLIDLQVALKGVARDAAMGAVVVTDDGATVYLDGLSAWPAAASSKRVEVKGTLRRKKLAPDPKVAADGGVSHGMAGTALVLENPTWTVERP